MADYPRAGSGLHLALDIWSRRKWLATGVFAGAFMVSLGIAYGLPAIYRATARVLVDRQQVPENFVRPAVTGEVDTRLHTISQEILSRARLESLAQRLKLYPGAPSEGVIEQMRRDIQLEPKAAEQPGSGGRAYTIAFNLSYRGRDPDTVAAVANALASFYVEENSQSRERQASKTAQFLRAQLDEMKLKIDEQERRVGTIPQGVEADMAALDRINTRLRLNSDRQLRVMDRRERLVKELGGEAGSAAGAASPDAAAARLAKLKQELTELRTRYSDKYPDVVRIKMEIAALEQRLEESKFDAPPAPSAPSRVAKDPVAEADQELRALREEERALRQAVVAAEQRAESAPRRQQEYQQKARDYTTTKELYQSLLKRYEDAQMAESMEHGQKSEQFRILDLAVPPKEPIGPNRPWLALGGLVLSLGLALAAVVIAERVDSSFHTLDDLRAFTRIPVLGAIPALVTARVTAQRQRRFRLAAASVGLGLLVIMAGSYFYAQDNEQLARMLSGIR